LDILAPIAGRWWGGRLVNIILSARNKQLLASGTVLILAGEPLLIKLEDGGEELSVEIIIQQAVPPPAERKPPQLSFDSISETSGKLTFLDTTGPFGIGYQVPLGIINKKKLTVVFRVANLVSINELKYSFWAEPKADG
jgi:hypothetical protein